MLRDGRTVRPAGDRAVRARIDNGAAGTGLFSGAFEARLPDRNPGVARHEARIVLRLSIARPTGPGPHPVVVWIHGGAYVAGGGDLPWYDGARLAAEQKLVIVSISYRLGPFGYLRLPGASGASNGLLDQITALRWVRRHIGAFGGDPANITVAGQSAGAHSISAIIAWGEAGPLFDRAVLDELSGRAAALRGGSAHDCGRVPAIARARRLFCEP